MCIRDRAIGVQDQGIGISESKKSSLFVRFENLLDKNLFNQQSSGIGLSLVKELVELHKATIRVDSKEAVSYTHLDVYKRQGDYLASHGYVVLAVDALFWGERGRKEGVRYDSQQALAANMLQMGMSWGALIAWDDIRSAEFLASLPMVHKEKIGTMGFSMGAHRAWMVSAATDVVKAGAAVCWMNTTDSLMTLTNNQNKGGSAYSMIIDVYKRQDQHPVEMITLDVYPSGISSYEMYEDDCISSLIPVL